MTRLLLAALFFAGFAPAQPQTQTAMSMHQANAACAPCHAAIVKSYEKTRMANASGLALEGLEEGSFTHSPSGVEYRISKQDGAAWLSYSRSGENPLQGRQKLQYFLGSGNHGRTYLYSVNGHWFETPVAFYARKQGYDIRPAYLNDKQMPLDLPVSAGCLRCHMSQVRKEDPGTRSHYTGLPFLQSGITCAGCHGESSAHVKSGGAAPAVNPAKLDAVRRDSICINCHLEGDVSVQHRGKNLADYHAGESIFDYVSYFVSAEDSTSGRAVSQVEALNLSACKRASGERMSCTSCHDPHGSPAAADKVTFYRQKCLACHEQQKFGTHFAEQQDCAACHMPKGAASDIPHEQWTDHRILRHPSSHMEAKLESAFGASKKLVAPVGIPSTADDRSLGLAYYNVVSQGDSSQSDQARNLLEKAAAQDPSDSAVLVALGVLAQWKGQDQQAYGYYLAALKHDPLEYTARVNAGVLLAKGEPLPVALKIWEPTFAANEDLSDLGLNLASAHCMLGDRAAAEDVLRRVLLYNPDDGAARSKLLALQSGKQGCAVP